MEFYFDNGEPKVRYKPDAGDVIEGTYSTGKENADLVTTYSNGVQCFYKVFVVDSQDIAQLILTFMERSRIGVPDPARIR